MKLVIKVGGSLCIGEDGPDHDYFSGLLTVLERVDRRHELSLGIGGGELVRKYGEAISDFDLSDEEREKCFIQLISANVKFLSYLLDKKPLLSLEEYGGGEVVVGGIKPGRSTDSNAALIAKEMDADLFIILTDVDGIYDKDPRRYEGAERIDEIGFEELEKLKRNTEPLHYGVVDPIALDVIHENRIDTCVINGEDPEDILKAIRDEKIGTRITD